MNTEHQMVPLSDLLQEAADIIQQGGWIKDPMAADARGNEVPHFDPTARQFCLTGAVARAMHHRELEYYRHTEPGANDLNSIFEPIGNFLSELTETPRSQSPLDDLIGINNEQVQGTEHAVKLLSQAAAHFAEQGTTLRMDRAATTTEHQ